MSYKVEKKEKREGAILLNHFHTDPEAFVSERAASAARAAPSSPAAQAQMDVPDAVPSSWINDMLIQTFHFFKERKKVDRIS